MTANSKLAEQLANWREQAGMTEDNNMASSEIEEAGEVSIVSENEVHAADGSVVIDGEFTNVTDEDGDTDEIFRNIVSDSEDEIDLEALGVDMAIDAPESPDEPDEDEDDDSVQEMSSTDSEEMVNFVDPITNVEISVPAEEFDETIEFINKMAEHWDTPNLNDEFGTSDFELYSMFKYAASTYGDDFNHETMTSQDFWRQFLEASEKLNAVEEKVSETKPSATISENTEQQILSLLSVMTDQLANMREEQMSLAIAKLLGSLSKATTTTMGDVTVIVAENTILRQQLSAMLELLDVKVTFSAVQMDRNFKVENRVVTFARTMRHPIRELTAGVNNAMDTIRRFHAQTKELEEARASKNQALTQRDNINRDLENARTELRALSNEVARLKLDVGTDNEALPGIVIRWRVSVKTTSGKVERTYYLSRDPNSVSKDGKISVRDFRRTDNISQAILFESKADALATTERLKKYFTKLDASMKMREAQLAAVEYVRQMERVL